MIVFQMIKGLAVGIEYEDDEELGFILNADLGFFRITWFKNIVMDE
jgi:hypothetical protein